VRAGERRGAPPSALAGAAAAAASVDSCSDRRKGSTPSPDGFRPISAMSPAASPWFSASVKRAAASQCDTGPVSAVGTPWDRGSVGSEGG